MLEEEEEEALAEGEEEGEEEETEESSAAAPGMGEASTIVWQPPQCTEITRYPRNLQTEGGEKDAQSSEDGCENKRRSAMRWITEECERYRSRLVSLRYVMSVRGESARGSVGTRTRSAFRAFLLKRQYH